MAHINSSPKRIPERLTACLEWSEVQQTMPYDIVSEETFFNDVYGRKLQETLILSRMNVEDALSKRGIECTDTNLFRYLVKPALNTILDYTQQSLVANGVPVTSELELLSVVATVFLRSSFNLSLDEAWKIMQYEANAEGFTLIERARYTVILDNIRGFDVVGRSPLKDDDAWMQQSNLLANLHDLEEIMFQKSSDMLLHRGNGLVVLDDELVSSRANDVESKTLSNRKAGKEGPVSDCIACSLTSMMYGMRLQTKADNQVENVAKLLKTLNIPTNANHDHKMLCACDRGYGKMTFIEKILSQGMDCITLATTLGSRHPFLTSEEVRTFDDSLSPVEKEQLEPQLQQIRKWIVDAGTEGSIGGSAVRVARKGNVTAISVCEKFDRKAETKIVRCFLTGNYDETLTNKWIFTKRVDPIPSIPFLFSCQHVSYATVQDKVEFQLALHTRPLTYAQRCADWFVMRQFRVTGTMASNLNQTQSQETVIQMCFKSWFKRSKSTDAMTEGTQNEDATIEALGAMTLVTHLYQVGLIEMLSKPYLAVSADGVAVLKMDEPGYDVTAIASVEIKKGFSYLDPI